MLRTRIVHLATVSGTAGFFVVLNYLLGWFIFFVIKRSLMRWAESVYYFLIVF